jgi:hypothetical protein
MPTPVDLVTDLPADFEVFGQAVDTSLADLKGGTSGQVLSKNSNTDMDFVWVTSDDADAIQNAIVDAKGDLIAATAADTPARLAVGTNTAPLVADSTASTGLKWDYDSWASYTPSAINITVGNGTLEGKYKQIGRVMHVYIHFTLGSTSALSNDAGFGYPVAGVGNSRNGRAVYVDVSTSNHYIGWWISSGFLRYQKVFGDINATAPFTWATGDTIAAAMTYEVF